MESAKTESMRGAHGLGPAAAVDGGVVAAAPVEAVADVSVESANRSSVVVMVSPSGALVSSEQRMKT